VLCDVCENDPCVCEPGVIVTPTPPTPPAPPQTVRPTPETNASRPLLPLIPRPGITPAAPVDADEADPGDDYDDAPPQADEQQDIIILVNDNEVDAVLDGDTVTLDLTGGVVQDLIDTNVDGTILFDLTLYNNVTSITIPGSDLATIADEGLEVSIQFPQGTVVLCPDAVYSLGQYEDADISITVNQGNNQVYVLIDAGDAAVGAVDGTVTVTLSSPQAEVWFVNEYGEYVLVPSVFCEETGTITFETSFLGVFVLRADNEAATRRAIRFVMNELTYTADSVPRLLDVVPFIDPAYNRVMIPLRAVVEALGQDVTWDEATRTVTIFTATGTVTLVVGVSLPDGMGVPVLIGDRVLVPLRYVSDVIGAEVRLDGDNNAVYVYIY